MNKYLEKVAQIASDENKQVAKTFATQAAVSIPLHLGGAAVGAKLGENYLGGVASKMNRGLGRTAGRVGQMGRLGRLASKGIRGAKMNGKALGALIGMQAAGGLGDLAALKAGFHQHGKKQ